MGEEPDDVGLIDAKLEQIGVPQYVNFKAAIFANEDTDSWFQEAVEKRTSLGNDDDADSHDEASADESEANRAEPLEAGELADEGELAAAVPMESGPLGLSSPPPAPAAYRPEDDDNGPADENTAPSTPPAAAASPAAVAARAVQRTPPSLAVVAAPDISSAPCTSSPSLGSRFLTKIPGIEGAAEPPLLSPRREAKATALASLASAVQLLSPHVALLAAAPPSPRTPEPVNGTPLSKRSSASLARASPSRLAASPRPLPSSPRGALALESLRREIEAASPVHDGPELAAAVVNAELAAPTLAPPAAGAAEPDAAGAETVTDAVTNAVTDAITAEAGALELCATPPRVTPLASPQLASEPAHTLAAEADSPVRAQPPLRQSPLPPSPPTAPSSATRLRQPSGRFSFAQAEASAEGTLLSAVSSPTHSRASDAPSSALRQPRSYRSSGGGADSAAPTLPPTPQSARAHKAVARTTTASRVWQPTAATAGKKHLGHAQTTMAQQPAARPTTAPAAQRELSAAVIARFSKPTAAVAARAIRAATAAFAKAFDVTPRRAAAAALPTAGSALSRLWQPTAATEAKRAAAAAKTASAEVDAAAAARADVGSAAAGAGSSAAATAALPLAREEGCEQQQQQQAGKAAEKSILARLWRTTAAVKAKQATQAQQQAQTPAQTPAVAVPRARPASALARFAAGGAARVPQRPASLVTPAPAPAALPLSTDELRLKQAEAEVAESRARQKQRAARLQRVLQDVGRHLPTRSTKHLTMPHEFQFASDARASGGGGHAADAAAGGGAVQPYRSLAESVSRFEFRDGPGATPERRADLADDSTLSEGGRKGPTQPRPFHLATDARVRGGYGGSRSQQLLSSEEMELARIRDAQAVSYARPVNPKVMNSHGDLGVPRVQKAAPTVFAEFAFASESRAAVRETQRASRLSGVSDDGSDASDHFRAFHARPVPKSTYTLERPASAGVGARRAPFAPTEARSPELATRGRARTSHGGAAHADPPSPHTRAGGFKARPMPIAQTPERIAPCAREPTQTHPFQLQTEARGVIAAHKLDEQRRREEAEAAKAREFRARGVPTHEPFAPAPSAQALCSPRPFQLRSEARGAIAQIHFDALVRAEEEARTSGAQFKAGKCTVTKEQPFQVHKSTKPLTELQDIVLRSDERHADRLVYEAEAHARKLEAEAAARAVAAEAAERERLAIVELRKGMEFKARPVPQNVLVGEPVSTAAVAKRAPTAAKSPQFATTMRSHARRSVLSENSR